MSLTVGAASNQPIWEKPKKSEVQDKTVVSGNSVNENTPDKGAAKPTMPSELAELLNKYREEGCSKSETLDVLNKLGITYEITNNQIKFEYDGLEYNLAVTENSEETQVAYARQLSSIPEKNSGLKDSTFNGSIPLEAVFGGTKEEAIQNFNENVEQIIMASIANILGSESRILELKTLNYDIRSFKITQDSADGAWLIEVVADLSCEFVEEYTKNWQVGDKYTDEFGNIWQYQEDGSWKDVSDEINSINLENVKRDALNEVEKWYNNIIQEQEEKLSSEHQFLSLLKSAAKRDLTEEMTNIDEKKSKVIELIQKAQSEEEVNKILEDLKFDKLKDDYSDKLTVRQQDALNEVEGWYDNIIQQLEEKLSSEHLFLSLLKSDAKRNLVEEMTNIDEIKLKVIELVQKAQSEEEVNKILEDLKSGNLENFK